MAELVTTLNAQSQAPNDPTSPRHPFGPPPNPAFPAPLPPPTVATMQNGLPLLFRLLKRQKPLQTSEEADVCLFRQIAMMIEEDLVCGSFLFVLQVDV
jgi:hypothetical protein